MRPAIKKKFSYFPELAVISNVNTYRPSLDLQSQENMQSLDPSQSSFKIVKWKGENMGDTGCKLRGQYIGGGHFCKERCNLSSTIDISWWIITRGRFLLITNHMHIGHSWQKCSCTVMTKSKQHWKTRDKWWGERSCQQNCLKLQPSHIAALQLCLLYIHSF